MRHFSSPKKVKLPKGEIAYRSIGTGRTIVFIHGLFLNGSVWDGLIADLSKDYQCIVPEWPFGSHWTPMERETDLSPVGSAELVADFIEELGLEDVVLVGGDFGAVVAKTAAARHGKNISGLVLTNCDALEVFPAKGFEYFAWLPVIPGAMWTMAKLMYHLEGLRQGPTSFGAFTLKPLPPEMTREFVKPLALNASVRRDAGKMMRGMDKELTLALPDELKDSGLPVLILWGVEDHLFPIDLGRRLCAAIGKRAELVEIPSAKAFVMLDAPAACANALSRFLKS